MSRWVGRWGQGWGRRGARRSTPRGAAAADSVVLLGSAGALVAVQLAVRAWILFRSWFNQDDFALIADAQHTRFTLGYLLDPWNSHLIPWGRALAWLVAEVGPLNWGVAVTTTLVVQALSSAAAVWMLLTLFGRRLGILVPLSLYLFSALTVPALMWWTAELNQLTMQLGFFVAVGAAWRYFRGDGLRWAFAVYGGLLLGLVADVKPLVLLPVFAYLALAYFATGGPLARLRTCARRYWPAVLIGVPLLAAYLLYYTGHVHQPYDPPTLADSGRSAEAMLGTAFPAGAVGGPWRWEPTEGYASPPQWTVHLAWLLIAAVIAYGVLRRVRTLRSWVLLAAYVVLLYGLVLVARVAPFGATIGLEYRYLTDAACVVALCVGLAFLEAPDAVGSSAPREQPMLLLVLPRSVVVGVAAAVALSGVVSTLRYDAWFRDQNHAPQFLHNLEADARSAGAVDLANTPVPEEVVSGLLAPDNTVKPLSALVPNEFSFPDWSPELGVVTDQGNVRRALITEAVTSQPGPQEDCGWRISELGRAVPLTGHALDWSWWIRVAYLANQDSTVTVAAGRTRTQAQISAGVGSLYVKIDGEFSDVRFSGLEDGAAMCVDRIEVGEPVPGGVFQ